MREAGRKERALYASSEESLVSWRQNGICRDQGVTNRDALIIVAEAPNVPEGENEIFNGDTIHYTGGHRRQDTGDYGSTTNSAALFD
jgi:hypothetical protein